MKKKVLILFSALAFLVVYSCRDEIFHSENGVSRTENETLEIETAKLFYNQRIHSISLPKTGVHANENNVQDSDSLQNSDYLYTRSANIVEPNAKEETPHVHSGKCNHGLSTRASAGESSLPELKESNIVLDWDRARVWEDSLASYVEVPMDMGGQVFALKRLEEEGKDAEFERTRIESMLVFEKKSDSDNLLCYIVTLVGDKSYLKSAGDKVKTFRHKPRGTGFTGAVFYSYLSGRMKRAFYYNNGIATHKLVKRTGTGADTDTRAVSASKKSLSISFFDMSVNGGAFTRSYEFFCFICYNYHDFNDADVCDFAQIVYCKTCNRAEDDCACCWNCRSYPCLCYNYCSRCWNDPCTCYTDNGCSICGNRLCTCNDDDNNWQPDNPVDDCPGPRCTKCSGLLSFTRATVSCPACTCTTTPNDPCSKSTAFSSGSDYDSFRKRVNNLYNEIYPHTAGTLENGWILASDGTVIKPFEQTMSSAIFSNASINGKIFTEWYHSHPGGGGAIPSLGDIKALAQRYQERYISADNFSYGIVSEYGCMSLIITSESSFSSFATKLRNKDLDKAWERDIIDAPITNYTSKMENLLKFFRDYSAGIEMLFRAKGENSWGNWSVKELDSNKNMVNKNCN